MLAFRDDLQVALYGDAARVAAKTLDQGSDSGAGCNAAGLTIQKDLHNALLLPPCGLAIAVNCRHTEGDMTHPIYVLGGPNLNLLGTREPEIYGSKTLADLEALVRAQQGGDAAVFRQTNHEGELVDWIQEAGREGAALILNAAAYTHTSVAVYDALKSIAIPIIEVHLSNPTAREDFRHTNFVAPVANATIAGLGAHGYVLAMDAARHLISLGGKTPK